MAKLSKYQKLQKKVISETKPVFALKDGKELYDALSNGENSYLRFDRFESSAMDSTWIKRIEETMPDLNDIVSNPKKTIQTLAEVVEVEKVRKTSRESVQHLASHSQFVKTIDEEGNVTPSKILNVYNDDFFAIYENKFIATLVRRLFVFVEKRYDYILHQATLRDVELLYFKNKTNIDGSDIEIETRIRYSKPALDSAASKMKEFLKRIEDIRKYLRFFANSEFMKILHRERDVRNPILQTNIIRKNPKYRNCYHLWQFLNSYMEGGLEVKVEEHYSKLSESDLKELNKVLTINFLALKGRDAPKEEMGKPKVYRPRILKTYDDEIFNPGRNFEGPIEFIRIDDKYREYKEGLKDLNPHPTKAMAEYLKDDYAENKARREETKQVDALIKRKENEYKKYQKEQEELLKKEEEDLQMVSDLAEQQIIEEQEEKLQPLRDMLANKAKEEETPKEEAKPKKEKKKPAKKKAPKKKPVKKEKPKEEPKKEVPKPEPIPEPVPEPAPEPIKEEKKPEPKPKKKVVKKKAPVKKKPKAKKEVVPEPVKEEVKEEPKEEPKAAPKAQKPKEKKKPVAKKQPVKKKAAPKKVVKPAPEKKPEPKPEPKPVPKAKPMSKKEARLAKRAEREEKKVKILKFNASRNGKKFGRR